MESERFIIKNRQGLKLVVQVDASQNPKNLAFIAHGQGGSMKQDHIRAFADAFLENNFRVVLFDATHSLGESEGEMVDVTYTSYLHDLEDVINWARGQEWFTEPFALSGASMGGTSTTWYAEYHPDQVLLLAPMAPVVNYEQRIKSLGPDAAKAWQGQGYKEEPSRSMPGVIGRVGWGVMENLKQYDLLPMAGKLTMPVLIMMGELDFICPYESEKLLYEKIPSKAKTFIKIPNAEHSFRNSQTELHGKELVQAKAALSSWLQEIARINH